MLVFLLLLCDGFVFALAVLQFVSEYSKAGNTDRDPAPSFLCGAPGHAAVSAAVYHRLNKHVEADKFASKVLDFATAVSALPRRECELLYGRCGYLYCILFVRRQLGRPEYGSEAATTIIDQVRL